MKKTHFSYALLLTALILSVICCFSSCSASNDKRDKSTVDVGSVNGTGISAAETDYYLPQFRSSVISIFTQKYNTAYDGTFWQTEFDGITPEEYLFDKAFYKAADSKLKLTLCKEFGLFDDISFAALKEKAEKFNKNNEGKKTVGITSIDMNVFYDYYVSNGVLALQNTLVDKGVIADRSDFDEWYYAKKAAAEIKKFQRNSK